jgi:hypothetical protein
MADAVRNAGSNLFMLVAMAWVLSVLINLGYVVVLLASFGYWTDGVHHEPFVNALTGFAVVGWIVLLVLGATALVSRRHDAYSRPRGAVVLLVCALGAAANAVPYLIHVAEAQVTAQGFAQARYDTSEDFDLTLSNRTGAAVRICLGQAGDCAPRTNTAAGLPPRGVVVRPGRTRKVEFSRGTYRLTIVDAAPGMTRTDTTVTVDPASHN